LVDTSSKLVDATVVPESVLKARKYNVKASRKWLKYGEGRNVNLWRRKLREISLLALSGFELFPGSYVSFNGCP
jgi:hypothetical protein